MKLLLIVGARPNFMKIAPIIREIKRVNSFHLSPFPFRHLLVHTGQHYDYEMSKVFFEDLELPEPDIYLGVGSGTHAEQTGKVMIEFEKVLIKEKPDLVIVVGDVNSTLACALASVKLDIPVAHVEAGLRSFDRTMPEEINRLLTDQLSDFLFTTSTDADENLKKEGIPKDKIFLVGNVMIDSLLYNLEKAKQSSILYKLGLTCFNQRNQTNQTDQINPYVLLTLHRPSNVDDKASFLRIINALTEISRHIPIIFPIHPRTRKQLESFGLSSYFVYHDFNSINQTNQIDQKDQIKLIDPLGYLDFLNLMMQSRFVMTDSGGIQEETTVLGIPCLTLRDNTERPITISKGTNVLVSSDTQKIIDEAFKILNGKEKKGSCPELWDGKSSERIVNLVRKGRVLSP